MSVVSFVQVSYFLLSPIYCTIYVKEHVQLKEKSFKGKIQTEADAQAINLSQAREVYVLN